MFSYHLEADKVCVLVSDLTTIEEEVVLLFHKLFKSVKVHISSHLNEDLGIFEVCSESVKSLWYAAVASMQLIKLLHLFATLTQL